MPGGSTPHHGTVATAPHERGHNLRLRRAAFAGGVGRPPEGGALTEPSGMAEDLGSLTDGWPHDRVREARIPSAFHAHAVKRPTYGSAACAVALRCPDAGWMVTRARG